jgi:hypothetical protein
MRYNSGRNARTSKFPNGTAAIMLFEHRHVLAPQPCSARLIAYPLSLRCLSVSSKAWLSKKGLSHWGNLADIRSAEFHDIQVSAMLFGEASMYNVLVNGRTPNLASNWVIGQGKMGFQVLHCSGLFLLFGRHHSLYVLFAQFYDTSVKSILSNMTFRNMSKSPFGDYAIRMMDHSDHFTPQGINSVDRIRFEDVPDNTIFGISNCGPACGTSRATMSSKIYSVLFALGPAVHIA